MNLELILVINSIYGYDISSWLFKICLRMKYLNFRLFCTIFVQVDLFFSSVLNMLRYTEIIMDH